MWGDVWGVVMCGLWEGKGAVNKERLSPIAIDNERHSSSAKTSAAVVSQALRPAKEDWLLTLCGLTILLCLLPKLL